MVYPNDHEPAHVHVIGTGCEAIFNLNCPHGPVELRENFRCKNAALRRIATALNAQLTTLCTAWERFHESV